MSLGSGLSKVAGKVFRIGHLGDCEALTLFGALTSVELGLSIVGVPHRSGGAMCHEAVGAAPARQCLVASESGRHLNRAGTARADNNKRPIKEDGEEDSDQGHACRAGDALRDLFIPFSTG